jgi:immune inhibitor A
VLLAVSALLATNVAIASAFSPALGPVAPLATDSGTEVGSVHRSVLGESSPRATRELLLNVVPPTRDEAEIARRYRGSCDQPPAQRVTLYRDESEGESRAFWVLDEPNRRFFQVQATLRFASEHLLFYVQDGQQVNRDALVASAAAFEQKTFPLLRQYFGELPERSRITIFNGRVPGVGGYFSATDMLPASVNAYSNERPMIFMSLDATRPGASAYDSVLAHEIQHFIHSQVHAQQDSWINEGASELAMAVAGYEQTGAARSYLNAPETQLDAWSERPAESQPHYGGGYLILEYFAQRLGGYEKVKDLISSQGSSVATFENYFQRTRSPIRFDDLFRDFVLANLLNDRTIADGRYGHEKIGLRARIQESFNAYPALSNTSVRPYATRFVELNPSAASRGDLELRFGGSGEARLYGAQPHSGAQQWWANAMDDMAGTLTREFDLSDIDHATLNFSAWFNTERDYDYAGVAISTDSGCSWRAIPGRNTTDSDPMGQNLGHGFTGRSDTFPGQRDGWLDEQMDLTPYAGKKVQVRFFYVTDQSYHGSGFAVDDVAIPEIGFADDAEQDTGWQTDGFLRSVNAAAVDWAVQIVTFTDGGPQIQQITPSTSAAGGAAEGTLVIPRFGDSVKRVVVAISPLVPVTLEPVEYRLQAIVR